MKISYVRFYLKFYRGRFGRLCLSLLLSAGRSLLLVPITLLIRYLFDTVLPQDDITNLVNIGLAIVALSIVSEGVTLWSRYLSLNTTKLVIRDMRHALLDKCFHFSRAFFHKTDLGRLQAIIVQDTQRLDVMSNALVIVFLPALLNIIVLSAVLLYLNATLFLILFLSISVFYAANHLIMKKRIQEKTQATHRAFERFSKGMLFVLQMMDLTRTQSAEEFEINRQKNHLEEVRLTSETSSFMYYIYSSLQRVITIIPVVLILTIGGYTVVSGSMSLGALFSFYIAVGMFKSHLNQILSILPSILEGYESLATLEETFQVHDAPVYEGHQKIPFSGNISLKNVSFNYQPEKTVLQQVSFEIQPGEIVAIIGPNGVGKSTITQLILGFYRPQVGTLFADGHEYETLDMASLRKFIGVVPQDPLLFAGTIYENIIYGEPGINHEQVEQAAIAAEARDFIQTLPQGYDTPVGELGVMLSGGQVQRIAIARALLRKPRLLILDEPTNHIDNETMFKLIQNIQNLPDKPSILLVTHVMPIANQADTLYSLDNEGILHPHHNHKPRHQYPLQTSNKP